MAAFMNAFGAQNAVRQQKVYRLKTNPLEFYEDAAFYGRFRFTKPIFRQIMEIVRPALQRKSSRGGALSVECQLAAALRYYASGSFQQVTGDTVGVSQPSICVCISDVSAALDSVIDDYIYFPTDNNELQLIKRGFHAIANFPNVIGAIDGTHVPVKRQPVDDMQYFNRKGSRSINVQCCCDHNGVFTNVLVKFPGSSHDSYILQNSNLWDHMEANPDIGTILGDSAYPLKPWLMTPLRNPTADEEWAYNSAQARTRVVVENAFGRLKRRFALLTTPNRRKNIANVASDIRACLILHNIATRHRLADFEGVEIVEDEPDDEDLRQAQLLVGQTGQAKRAQLLRNVFHR